MIHYYNINSNNKGILYPHEMKHETYTNYQSIIIEAKKEQGINLKDNTNLKLIINEGYYLGKLSLQYHTNCVPLLITGGVSLSNKHSHVWNEMIRMKNMLFPLYGEEINPPSLPYIVDMASPSLYNQLEVFDWTKELTTNIGFILLSTR